MALISRLFGIALLASFPGNSQPPTPAPTQLPVPAIQRPTPAQPQPPATANQPPATQPPATAPKPATPPPADSNPGVAMIESLLSSLDRFDREGHPAGRKLGFEIPEKALNDYIVYALRVRPRPGISAITVSLLPNNQISSDVEIDFDAVKKWNSSIIPEAFSGLFTGKRTVHADLTFESQDGSVKVDLKDAKGPDGKAIVNKMMSAMFQALGSRQPESLDPAKPITLPFGLKRIWTGKQLICGET